MQHTSLVIEDFTVCLYAGLILQLKNYSKYMQWITIHHASIIYIYILQIFPKSHHQVQSSHVMCTYVHTYMTHVRVSFTLQHNV